MSSDQTACGIVLQRVHQLRPRRAEPIISFVERLSDRHWFIATLIAAAVSLHFWCCDWRVPAGSCMGADGLECTSFDNKLIGFVHAGKQFRIPAIGGAWYDIDSAAWLGLYLPEMLAFVALTTILSELAPERYRAVLSRYRSRLLGSRTKGLRGAALALVLVMILGVSTAAGSAYISQSEGLVFVASANDSANHPGFSVGRELCEILSTIAVAADQPSSSSTEPGTFFSQDRNPSLIHAPEPGTFILLSTAAAGLLLYGWRKRQRG